MSRRHRAQPTDDWTVVKSVDELRIGDRFVFSPEYGGEGEVLTVDGGVVNLMGTRVVPVAELEEPIEFHAPTFVQLPKETR